MKINALIGEIIENAITKGLSKEDCTRGASLKDAELKYIKQPYNIKRILLFTSTIVVLFAIKSPRLVRSPKEYFAEFKNDYLVSRRDKCIVDQTPFVYQLTRPISSCDFCKNIEEVPLVENMTRAYFLKYHAYTGSPVLIKGGASNWTALQLFSYEYFKMLYDKLEAHDENDELGCQFFHYKTNFRTLKQFFRMSKKRAALRKDQWYIGWSNCAPRVTTALRKYYSRPEFLPDDSESSHIDWMFMGGSGTGAQMHIDAVNRPSWQAMIKGKKTWNLSPPPECEFECTTRMNVTMEPGDILVVDTNRWYHSTFIHPGSLSMTIGSEYD